MISEGSSDTEDWSNHRNKLDLKYFKIEKSYCNNIVITFHNISVFTVFYCNVFIK